MRIINLDSKIDFSPAQLFLAESVIKYDKEHPYFEGDSISELADEIPIFLLSPESMPKDDLRIDGHNDWLGVYIHSCDILGVKTPVIGLCPERFMNSVKNEDELNVLIAKVIIHEFAHALMAMHPGADYYPMDEFFVWMEEPMANMIALLCLKKYSDGVRQRGIQHYDRFKRDTCTFPGTIMFPFNYSRFFMMSQPPNYRLGIELYNKNLWDWQSWREHKAHIRNMDDSEKKPWLDYVIKHSGKNKNDYNSFNEKQLKELFDALIEKAKANKAAEGL